MVGELDLLNEWIPEQMQPGTVFVLENAGEIGEKEDPYWAVLACPSCGMLGLITRKQINGFLPAGSAAPSIAPPSSSSATMKSWCANRSNAHNNLQFEKSSVWLTALGASSRFFQLHRNLLHNLNPETFECGHFFRTVGEQADAAQIQV